MKKILAPIALLIGTLAFSQAAKDTIESKVNEIEEVTFVARKPTVESKVDRTVFNVANSSILAGNTTWDVLRMTPLVSIDNNDALKAEGESVTVYINDRKSVFTGKELKEYLQTMPADNLMKIEVITSPSSRYEASGSVINIVLKKRDDEGLKGSVTFNNRQNTQNSQYTNLNLNYHKKNFTQTLVGSYSDNTWVQRNSFLNTFYENNVVTEGSTNNIYKGKNPSISSTSEYELNDKNTIGLILEAYQGKRSNNSDALGTRFENNILDYSYDQNQNSSTLNRTFGTNFFYKYYDKEKNRILDINLGTNYDGEDDNSYFIKNKVSSTKTEIQETRLLSDVENRNYYIKVDYTQPIGKSGGNFEIGGKMDFNNNVIPNQLYANQLKGLSTGDTFHYQDNINSVYANYSKTFFKKLETRIGLRYEHIDYKFRQDVAGTSRDESYGKLLPNILLKYSFSDKYDLSLTYNKNLWRPWYAEFNPFMQPTSDGFYSRGNMELNPNPSDRFYMKFGFLKKYFLSARYTFTDQDYWTKDVIEGDKIISEPANFVGKVHKYNLYANTNQSFLKNKLNVNLSFGWNYLDNSDFNTKNDLNSDNNYISYWAGSTNLTYTNLFNKNINLSAWVEVSNQNNGNSVANKTNVFHNISATKIFPKTQLEFSLQLMNIFARPTFDSTTFSPTGSRRNSTRSDWYGASFSIVKRFGNQKVKENTKTDVEKNSGGGK
ncbi:outer membrane beta-barrel protein [Chryseobacterium turcicum]|uniref:Outer membrane beta-barrel protein n=1 Tax=Chryseobacterium turcicum TaxID=2898076 RepID=A0A9Q3V215_9FLAO|nr:outer membrane beta-barrel protein [Chryseobacterium turcicum]MCD1117384.1 outer membrane beta-barrel protein [Chryseobacterium turcicum]